MSATRNSLQRNTLSAALFSALALTATGAMAQDTSTDESKPATTETKNATDLDKIVVTGSRIARDNFNSISPVTVVTREESTLAGYNSTAGILQGTKVTGGQAQVNNAFGGFVTDGGPGANTIGLRGMQANRTLVLLNGRRISPAGTRGSVGSADLNTLPNAMIDHIEVLKDGASSIYGSDAVAGVINIVTRQKVDEVSVEGRYNFTADGGGDEARTSVVFGKTGDSFDFSGSFEHYDRNELTLADRDWTKCNTDYRGTAAGGAYGTGDFIDPRTGLPKCYTITGTGGNGVTINTIGTNTRAGVGAPGSVGTTFNRWRPNAAVTTGLVGYEGVGGGANNLNVRDTFEPRMLNKSLISPAEVDTLFLQGSKDTDVLGNASIYFELLGNNRDSQQTGYRQLSLDYIKGSPLIPANLQSSTFSAVPTNTSNGLPVGVRAFIGFGNDHSNQDVSYNKFTAGMRGSFFLTDWNYDASVSKAWNSAKYTFESFLTDRLAQSLDVVAGPNGTFVCRNPANGCIAAPALTPAVVGGQLPADWANWVFRPVVGQTSYQETTANFNVNGPLFEMPAGDVRSAFGVEYRAAAINDQPSPEAQAGNLYNLTSGGPTVGKDYVAEAYGEVEVPILSGVPGAQELTVNVSGRYTDYHSYGSDTTYKVGLLWTPINWLSLRATYGTSFRAPALSEQFLGGTTGFLSSQSDPCSGYQADGSIRARNCALEGLPVGFSPTSGVTVITAGGAAQGLLAETSKNFTGGIVLQPEFPTAFGNLSFAADFYRIEVNNGVGRAGAGGILAGCYDDPNFTADPATRTGLCRYVEARAPGSNALTVNDNYTNISTDYVRGWDFNTRYTRDIGPGTFRATLDATHMMSRIEMSSADDPRLEESGTLRFPEWTATLDTTYTVKNWTARYGAEWIDAMDSSDYLELDDAQRNIFKAYVSSYMIHSASLRYRGDKWEVSGGVRNLFDKEPPVISQGIGYNRVGNAPLYSGYDYVGRTYFVSLSKTF